MGEEMTSGQCLMISKYFFLSISSIIMIAIHTGRPQIAIYMKLWSLTGHVYQYVLHFVIILLHSRASHLGVLYWSKKSSDRMCQVIPPLVENSRNTLWFLLCGGLRQPYRKWNWMYWAEVRSRSTVSNCLVQLWKSRKISHWWRIWTMGKQNWATNKKYIIY